jgi:hypothetical protein
MSTTNASTSGPGESILDRLRQRSAPAALGHDAPVVRAEDEESPIDCGAFGWLRGVKDQAIMLELRLRTGNVVAVSYAYVERAEYDPSEGITLHLGGGKRVRIEGANLNASLPTGVRLFDGIVRRRVTFVRELNEGDKALPRVARIEC